jgi:hypothetical protein
VFDVAIRKVANGYDGLLTWFVAYQRLARKA